MCVSVVLLILLLPFTSFIVDFACLSHFVFFDDFALYSPLCVAVNCS